MTDSGGTPESSTPSVVAGLLGGLLYTCAVNWWAAGAGYPVLEIDHPVKLYPIVLLMAAGSVPTYAFLRRRIVTPTVVLAAATYLWIAAEADVDGPGDPFAGFLGLLPLWIGLMVLGGVAERRLRERLFGRSKSADVPTNQR